LCENVTRCLHFENSTYKKPTRDAARIDFDLVMRLVRLTRLEAEELEREAAVLPAKPLPARKRAAAAR
jgi:hypothetical protein